MHINIHSLPSQSSCFPWSSVRCFYILIGVHLNSINWTLFRKSHTCLYKVQMADNVRAQNKPQGPRNCLTSESRVYRGTDLGKCTETLLQHWRSQWAPCPPSLYMEEVWRTLPRAYCPASLSDQGKRALLKEVINNLVVTLTELLHFSVERGEPSRKTVRPVRSVWLSG